MPHKEKFYATILGIEAPWHVTAVELKERAEEVHVTVALGVSKLGRRRVSVVLDELHRYPHRKSFLKGLFDVHGQRIYKKRLGAR